MITDKELGEVIKNARLRRRWSQQKLADRMNRAGGSGCRWIQTTVAKTEAGDRPIRVKEVFLLAALFDIDLNAMIVPVDPPCPRCEDSPPEGFTCNDCGAAGVRAEAS